MFMWCFLSKDLARYILDTHAAAILLCYIGTLNKWQMSPVIMNSLQIRVADNKKRSAYSPPRDFAVHAYSEDDHISLNSIWRYQG